MAQSVMAGLPVGQPRSRGWILGRSKMHFSSTAVQTGSGLHPEPCCIGNGCLSSTVKRRNREASHLSPYSTEFKNEWSFTSPPPYAFMASTETNLLYHKLNLLTECHSALLVKTRFIIFPICLFFFKNGFKIVALDRVVKIRI